MGEWMGERGYPCLRGAKIDSTQLQQIFHKILRRLVRTNLGNGTDSKSRTARLQTAWLGCRMHEESVTLESVFGTSDGDISKICRFFARFYRSCCSHSSGTGPSRHRCRQGQDPMMHEAASHRIAITGTACVHHRRSHLAVIVWHHSSGANVADQIPSGVFTDLKQLAIRRHVAVRLYA